MPVGGYYVDASGLDQLAKELAATAGGVRDLSAVYRSIGRHAEVYVKGHWPIWPGSPKDGSGHKDGALQLGTKGGGGRTAWVRTTDGGAGHLMVQEFGGTSYWYRGPAGLLRAMNRGHRAIAEGTKVNGTGHTIYKKPRRPLGYVIWNVAWRLRDSIGRDLTHGIRAISEKHGLHMDVTDSGLSVEQRPWSRAA